MALHFRPKGPDHGFKTHFALFPARPCRLLPFLKFLPWLLRLLESMQPISSAGSARVKGFDALTYFSYLQYFCISDFEHYFQMRNSLEKTRHKTSLNWWSLQKDRFWWIRANFGWRGAQRRAAEVFFVIYLLILTKRLNFCCISKAIYS